MDIQKIISELPQNSKKSLKDRLADVDWIALRLKPKLVFSFAGSEDNAKIDYTVRAFLKLPLNADDAPTEPSPKGEVSFELSPEGLLVENSANTFSAKGFSSIHYAEMGSKHQEMGALNRIGSTNLRSSQAKEKLKQLSRFCSHLSTSKTRPNS
ncbi:hypothetical protein RUE5091_00114 [Ruegeria denitrificans]|uniref:Uncharacterized protein n=1 Tax=Ruegeria denitrificans TaxID=1715692 RepID=A0A0P1I9A8_9RHOB|nr:hypothetical protein [Ruegeria denitrificans]CUJ83474.1 hypothetical protein RUE5091_00114 [Ruegeria denitrificans]